MIHRYLRPNAAPSAQPEGPRRGSSDAHPGADGLQGDDGGPSTRSVLTEREMLFIDQRDSFYLASVSKEGWPSVQHRGGRPGFICAPNPKTIIFPDVARNQPALTTGNVAVDDRVALIFVDYAKSRRLMVAGHLTLASLEDAPYLEAELFQRYGRVAERIGSIRVEAFDWNCGRHFTRRYTAAELAPLTRRVSALEAENAILQARIAAMTERRP